MDEETQLNAKITGCIIQKNAHSAYRCDGYYENYEVVHRDWPRLWSLVDYCPNTNSSLVHIHVHCNLFSKLLIEDAQKRDREHVSERKQLRVNGLRDSYSSSYDAVRKQRELIRRGR